MIEEDKDDKNIKKSIEIVIGDSKNLKISDVKDSLIFENHENDAAKNGEIIVPENQKTEQN